MILTVSSHFYDSPKFCFENIQPEMPFQLEKIIEKEKNKDFPFKRYNLK